MLSIENTIIVYNITLLSALFLLKGKKGRKGNVILAYLILAIVAAIRFDVGADYDGYSRDVEILKEIFQASSFSLVEELFLINEGPFFSFFVFLFRNSTHTMQIIVALYSFLEVFLLYRVLEKYKAHFWGVLLFIISCLMFNIWDALRQGLAILFVLNAVPFIEERNIKGFLLFVFFAACAHYTALIILPFYWICNLRYHDKICLIIIFLLFILAQFELFTSISSKLSEIVPYYSDTYAANDKYTSSGETVHDPSYIFTVFWYVMLLLFSPSRNSVFKYLLFTASCIYIVSGGNLNMDRVAFYFSCPIIIYIKGVYDNVKKGSVKHLSLVTFLFLMYILFNIHINSGTYKGCSPYETIFSDEYKNEVFRSNE